MNRALPLAVFAVVAGAFFALRFRNEGVKMATSAPAETAAQTPGPDRVVESSVAQPSEPPPPRPVAPTDGFCPRDDGDQSFQIAFTVDHLHRKTADPGVRAALERVLAAAPGSPERLEAVRRARRLAPRDPALGWELAALTRNTLELDEAIEGLSDTLEAAPHSELARMRALLEVQRDIQKDYQRLDRAGTTLAFPRDLLSAVRADELMTVLSRALDDAAQLTGTRRRATLTAVVYPSRSELLAVTCVKAWTVAAYDGTLRIVAAGPDAGIDLKTLRHEVLHAQMSAPAHKAPRWFHEGVAQSFAGQVERRGLWRRMVQNRVWVPFSSLDGSFQAFEASDDASLVYHQAYAMAELLRDCGGDRAVASAIAAFDSGETTASVLANACGRAELGGEDLLRFMERTLEQTAP